LHHHEPPTFICHQIETQNRLVPHVIAMNVDFDDV
jgi:hypothetical protein